jgi:prepilin-type N-terminal cleavage/methylation domain-containing protein
MENQTNHGFTLLELVMVMVLLSIMTAAVGILVIHIVNLSRTHYAMTDMSRQLQFALRRIQTDMRQMRSHPTLNLARMGTTAITFTTIAGKSVNYHLSGHMLMRNQKMLADGIESLQFHYYQSNGRIAQRADQVSYINIALTKQTQGHYFRLMTTLFPRN